MRTIRLVLLAALLFSLVRVVIVHSAHVGLLEWIVSAVIAVALVASLVATPRHAG